jgi:hypothetical protein
VKSIPDRAVNAMRAACNRFEISAHPSIFHLPQHLCPQGATEFFDHATLDEKIGAFLRAGLVDELNLILCPAVDGAKGAPSVFDSTEAEADQRPPITAMTLEGTRALEDGAMLLRYRIQNASPRLAA